MKMIVKSNQNFERYSLEQKKNIFKLFKIRSNFLPEEFREEFLKTQLKLFYKDEGDFLSFNGGLNRLAEFSVILKKLGKDISKVDLFEAGAHSKPDGKYFYNQNIPYFMANNLGEYNYSGFEPENNFTDEELSQFFSEKKKDTTLFGILNEKDFKSNLEKCLTSDYNLFKHNVLNSKDPVIFSNLVVGCPNIKYHYDFWNLPGLHVDQFIIGDLVEYRDGESLDLVNNRITDILKKNYGFSTSKINFIDGFDNKIIYYSL